ncbi:MAG TPA: YbdK family carboxylate-amine ligase [Thermoleophilaceae bacterium]
MARSTELPIWARWGSAAAERPWTVGVEDELVLLDPHDWSAANQGDDVQAVLPARLAAQVSNETHACVLELKSSPHETVAQVASELATMRERLGAALYDELGARCAAAGTHPLAVASDIALSSSERYRKIGSTMRALAHREPTMALHVHVAVPDPSSAVRALDGLRAELPLLLALSANSPFWRGVDSGFASIRTPIMSMFPRVGIPQRFGSYGRFVDVVETLIRSGAIPEVGFLWWDARLQPRLGTLEIRVTDAQTRIADVAAIAAVVQCLVRHYANNPSSNDLEPEVVAENRFLAARDGLRARLIDSSSGLRRPAIDSLAELLEGCRPYAAALGCSSELLAASALAQDPGDVRQRRIAAEKGLAMLPAELAAEFAGSSEPIAAV